MRDIKNYEGLYAVTSCGKVWSYRSNRFMKLTGDGGNYQSVCLTKDGKHRVLLVHRLVAEAYIPNPNNYPQVNHKDERKNNNCVDNLEWCTPQQNLTFSRVWEATRKPVYCIELDKTFPSVTAAARALNISQPNLSSCVRSHGKYTVGGYHWKFANENCISI